jgi:hypothetical protein
MPTFMPVLTLGGFLNDAKKKFQQQRYRESPTQQPHQMEIRKREKKNLAPW